MIVCLGTTPTMQRTMLFDRRVALDGVNRASETREYASGKSVNVAKVLRTLGNNAVATGFVGGRRGARLTDYLDSQCVKHDFVTADAETRLCTTVIDRETRQVTELIEEPGAVSQDEWQALAKKLEELLPQAATWVFSGSLAPGAPSDFLTRWLARFRGKNPQVVIDASGEPLREALRQPGVLAKCNLQEFEWTLEQKLGDETALKRAMEQSTPQGGGLVVTLGRDGALSYEMGRFWRVRVPDIKVMSAVGSGDAFAAGLASGRHKKFKGDPGQALALAAACGAANAMTTDSGWVRPTDLGEILPKVVVEELS